MATKKATQQERQRENEQKENERTPGGKQDRQPASDNGNGIPPTKPTLN